MKFSEEWSELILEIIMLTPFFMLVGILVFLVIGELVSCARAFT